MHKYIPSERNAIIRTPLHPKQTMGILYHVGELVINNISRRYLRGT